MHQVSFDMKKIAYSVYAEKKQSKEEEGKEKKEEEVQAQENQMREDYTLINHSRNYNESQKCIIY
jgi:hypothetical protein